MNDMKLIEMLKKMKTKCEMNECRNCKLAEYYEFEGSTLSTNCRWLEFMDELYRSPSHFDIKRIEELLAK